jgi:hypothetical protein
MRYIYVIGPPGGPQKVGLAANARRRVAELQVGSHTPLKLGFSVEIEAAEAWPVESYAHWILRDHSVGGEWFSVSVEDAVRAIGEAIAAVRRGERKGSKSVGRKKRWSEDMVARFPEGTFARIDAVREEGEDRTDFVREAVERELKRRERHLR